MCKHAVVLVKAKHIKQIDVPNMQNMWLKTKIC